MGFLSLQLEVVDDGPCGFGRAAKVSINFKIDRWLIGLSFLADSLKSSQCGHVGDFVELTSRRVCDSALLLGGTHHQPNEADLTTVVLRNGDNACCEAWWHRGLRAESECERTSLSGCLFNDVEPESFSEFHKRPRTEREHGRQKIDN